MRLTKPTLAMTQSVLACDSGRDLPLDSFRDVTSNDLTILPSMQHFALSEILTLPQNFGLAVFFIKTVIRCVRYLYLITDKFY